MANLRELFRKKAVIRAAHQEYVFAMHHLCAAGEITFEEREELIGLSCDLRDEEYRAIGWDS